MENLKKTLFAAAMMVVAALNMSAQPPTVMPVADDAWAKAHNYGKMSEKGRARFITNQDECMLDQTFVSVAAEVNSLFQNYGLEPVNLQAQNEGDDEEEAFEEMYEGKDGSTTQTTAFDDLLKKAKPDILVKIGWTENKVGFNKSISFRMDCVDSYSNKSVATVTAESEVLPSVTPMSAMVKSAINNKMPELIEKLKGHVRDMRQGVEMRFIVNVKDGSGVDLDSEFDGETLITLINRWLSDNTVNHQYNQRSASPNRMEFNGVKVAPRAANGQKIEAYTFAEGLKKYLRSLGINAENRSTGLGRCRIYISD